MTTPIFVVFEGIDGSGHTTQAKLLTERLIKLGKKAEFTFEPTDSPIGKLIRKCLSGEFVCTQPETLAAQFLLDRYEHYWGKIVPWIEEEKIVVCDRYHLSWEVYQGQSLTKEWLAGIYRYLAAAPPHLTILLDMAGKEEEAMNRVDARGGTKEIYEKIEFQKKIAGEYLKLARHLRTSTVCTAVLDATLPIEKIADEVLILAQSVMECVKEHNDLLNVESHNSSFTPTGISAIYWKSVWARDHYYTRKLLHDETMEQKY